MRIAHIASLGAASALLLGVAPTALAPNLDRDRAPERLIIRAVDAPDAAAAQPKRYFVVDGDADPVPIGPVFGRAPRVLVADRNLDGVRDLRITAGSAGSVRHDEIWQYDGERREARPLARIDSALILGPGDEGRVGRLRRVAFGRAGTAGTVGGVPNLYLLGEAAACRVCSSSGPRSVRMQYSGLERRWVVYPGNRRDSWWPVR